MVVDHGRRQAASGGPRYRGLAIPLKRAPRKTSVGSTEVSTLRNGGQDGRKQRRSILRLSRWTGEIAVPRACRRRFLSAP